MIHHRFGHLCVVAGALCLAGATQQARAQGIVDSGVVVDAGLVPDAGLLPDAGVTAPQATDAGVDDAAVLDQVPVALEADAALSGHDAAVLVDEPPEALPPAPVTAVSQPTKPAQPNLAPAAIEVTVVGTPLARTAGSAHIIRKKDLERFELDDPTKVLLAVPGVYIRGEDGMGLRPNIAIRGVDPDRSKKITLLEDGVLFGPSPYSAPADYYFPIITRMENVKVIKGPGTIAFGPQTIAGTIDLTTRSIPTTTSGGADIGVGQYGYGKAHVYGGSSNEQVGFLIEGVRLQNNGFKELPSGADTGFVRNEWMVKGSYIIDPRARIKNELRLKLTYSDEVSNESYLGVNESDFKRNPDQRYLASQLDQMRNHRTSVVLTHRIDITPKLSITTNVYRHEFHRTWRKVNGLEGADLFQVLLYPDAYRRQNGLLKGTVESAGPLDSIIIGPNQRDFVSQGVESRLRWDKEAGGFGHRLEVGARYHYDSIERRHSESDYLVQNGELVPEDKTARVWALNKAATHAVALHAIYAGSWKGLTVTPGVRTELLRSSDNDQLANDKDTRFVGVVLPGAGAFYSITNNVGVLAGVYKGFSPPAPGSPKREKPEESIAYEGGARFALDKLRLESIGFLNDYSNMTQSCTTSTGCGSDANFDSQVSLGAVNTYGVEVAGDYEVPAGVFKVPLQLAYTNTRSEFMNDVTSPVPSIGEAKKGDELPYMPRHQLRATAGLEHARGGANVAFTYVDKTREKAGSLQLPGGGVGPRGNAFTDTQYVVDLGAFAKVWKTISVYATVQNLFDSRYIVGRRPFGARPNAPRWLQVGVKGSF